MRPLLNFFRDLWLILSGRSFEEFDLWYGPITSDKLEQQREWFRLHPIVVKRPLTPPDAKAR